MEDNYRPRRLLTVVDVALRWKCSPETVRRLVRAGRLQQTAVVGKRIRFTEAQIEAYEREQRA